MKIITSGKGRSSRKIHECGVKPCWCGKSRIACCIPYAENDGYWLKLCQFGDDIDISVLNKLEEEDRKGWQVWEED